MMQGELDRWLAHPLSTTCRQDDRRRDSDYENHRETWVSE